MLYLTQAIYRESRLKGDKSKANHAKTMSFVIVCFHHLLMRNVGLWSMATMDTRRSNGNTVARIIRSTWRVLKKQRTIVPRNVLGTGVNLVPGFEHGFTGAEFQWPAGGHRLVFQGNRIESLSQKFDSLPIISLVACCSAWSLSINMRKASQTRFWYE